jgi:hypothetical protein
MTNALAPTAAEDAVVQIGTRSEQDPLAIESMTIKKIDESEK